MARPAPGARPTDAELEILRVLWERGPSTVREVHDALSATRDTGYTTILKLLQIMWDKGLVVRDESQRSHIYSARAKQQQTQQRLVRDLVEKVFGGATEQLVLQALSARQTTPEEIAEIRRIIEEWSNEQKKK